MYFHLNFFHLYLAQIFTVEMMQKAFKKIKSSGEQDEDEIEIEQEQEVNVQEQQEAPLPPKKKFLSKCRQMLQLKKSKNDWVLNELYLSKAKFLNLIINLFVVEHALKDIQILVKDLKDVVGMARAREEFNRPENTQPSEPNVQQAREASHVRGRPLDSGEKASYPSTSLMPLKI